MNHQDIADQEVVPAQFLAFALACALILFGSLFPSAFSGIAYKLADAVFITSCVLVAMKLALTPRQPATSLIIHADQGGQYTSAACRARVDQAGAVPSFSRPGNPPRQRPSRSRLEHPQDRTPTRKCPLCLAGRSPPGNRPVSRRLL